MNGLVTKLLFCSTTLFSILTISIALDTISTNQTIRDGETLVSVDGGNFQFGLFRPSNFSNNRYLGIWYKKISAGNDAVVWVANREAPLTDAFGIIRLNSEGVLQLINSSNSIIWSSNSSRSTTRPVAQLLDSGNLVIRDESASGSASPKNFIWQSFDYPGDTILPGVKFGKDLVTGIERYMSSWKSVDDPSPGEFTVYFDLNGYPQVFQRKGSLIEYRLGGWNGLRFTGMPSIKPNPIYMFEFVFNQEEIYYKWDLINSTVISKVKLTPDGSLIRLTWNERTQDWFMYSTPTTDACAPYALCGPNGNCNSNKFPPCGCLEGFEPKFQEQWNRAEWFSGCRRRVALDCASDEGFRRYFNVKQPDTRQSWFNQNMSLAKCETMCNNNCSCTAYSNLDIRGSGSGCLLWFGDLIDIREYSENGQDIYIRMAASELGLGPKTKKGEIIKVVFSTLAGLVLLGTTVTVYAWTWKKKGSLPKRDEGRELHTGESAKKDVELQLFSLSTIVNATNNFSHKNKLGEGGFGPVYKGLLEEGQEVAVKRLSKTSKQGLDEFKNEVICIAKLQHRNLVKLLGCCTHGDEMMLVYEYMPNKSLDCFIFEESQRSILDWPKRFRIIIGIARGLMYLHQDSRLRIVHRDLKAGNILLDSDMNPRISDFGLARRFGGLETEANTNKVVGTYGYISPEYAVNGVFSVKSDVFSFGVLILETVSGKKNRGFSHGIGDHHDNLLGHAWRLYREGKSLELIDESLGNSCTEPEVVRSIHVGLLCVQQCAEDRPSMSTVVMMLGSEGVLPVPKQPGFFIERSIPEINGIQSILLPEVSINETTMTILDAR